MKDLRTSFQNMLKNEKGLNKSRFTQVKNVRKMFFKKNNRKI